MPWLSSVGTPRRANPLTPPRVSLENFMWDKGLAVLPTSKHCCWLHRPLATTCGPCVTTGGTRALCPLTRPRPWFPAQLGARFPLPMAAAVLHTPTALGGNPKLYNPCRCCLRPSSSLRGRRDLRGDLPSISAINPPHPKDQLGAFSP